MCDGNGNRNGNGNGNGNGNAYDRGDYNSSFALRAVELKNNFIRSCPVVFVSSPFLIR